jgi:hypothetical protein
VLLATRHIEHGIEPDEVTNVTDRILGKIGTNLHKEDKHPLNTIKKRIEQYFVNKYTTEDNKPLFNIYDSFKPVVSVKVRGPFPRHRPSSGCLTRTTRHDDTRMRS